MSDEPRSYLCVPEGIDRDPRDVFAEMRPKAAPEMELAYAVMGQAIVDLRRGPATQEWRPAYEATVFWVQQTDRRWPFSFASLCELFGLDLEATRERMLAIEPIPHQRYKWAGYGVLRAARPAAVSVQMRPQSRRKHPKRWAS